MALSPQEKKRIQETFKPVSLKKGDFFIKPGQFCNHIAYAVSGKLRVYYLDDNGNEVTCFFVSEPQFISSYTSFLTETPTREHIEALEDTELLMIHRDPMEALCREIPKLHILRRVIAENLFILMEKRITMLQSHSAQERYEMTLKEQPDLLLKVPLQYTASFLGITPQHLSRLRKQRS